MTQGLSATFTNSNITLTNGSPPLTATDTTSGSAGTQGTETFSAGKYYWEVHIDSDTDGMALGVCNRSVSLSDTGGHDTTNIVLYDRSLPDIYYNGNPVSSVDTSFTTGDVVGVQWDATSSPNTIQFFLNGTAVTAGGVTVSPIDITTAHPITTPLSPFVGFNGGTHSDAVTMRFAQGSWSHTPGSGFGPFDTTAIFVDETTQGEQARRPRRRHLIQQDDTIQPVTRFQTFTPPIGFDEDRGERIRRIAWRAHTQPIQDDWIQKQTLFQTTTPPIGFDEDRGERIRRVAWRAHPQPDYPEQQPVTRFQTFTPPIGFDEDRGIQIRRVAWRARPEVLAPGDFLRPTIFIPIEFDEDRGSQIRRTAWRQHNQAVTDNWFQAPTVFVPLGFDEDRGRQQRRLPIAHPQPQDDWLQSTLVAPFSFVGFDEDRGQQVRRPPFRQRTGVVDDTLLAPTTFVPLGFDEDRGIQVRRPRWTAYPQPQDDWLEAFPVAAWGFDEEGHAQVRRSRWSAYPQPQDDWLAAPPAVVFAAWGFDEEQHAQIRRVAWRAFSGTRPDDAEAFPFVLPPTPSFTAAGNVIFGVIRNLF